MGRATCSARYEFNQLVRENDTQKDKTTTYEYVNGNIKYIHEYDYTTGTLPSTPLKTTEFYYNNSNWSDVLTGVSQYSYGSSNVSTYGLRNNTTSSIEEYARSILGDDLGDYEIVDFGSKALLNPQSESSGVSTQSLPSSAQLDFSYSVTSDEIGNITNIDGIQIEWNGRRVERVQKGNDVITYEYNMDGQRVSKTVNGVKTEYFYNGDILAGQKTGNDEVVFMYDNNGDIFGFNYNGEEYYYVKNAQNDVILILNGDRTAAVVYQYDAWGNITGALDLSTDRISNINPLLYRSYYYDIEMGVYYLNSRYYAPVICRFISGDSVVADAGGDMLGYNLFAYCQNNPVNMSDADGNWPKWATKLAIGAAIVATVAVVAAITVATAGAGTAIAAVAIGAAKGAAIGYAAGAIIGAGVGYAKTGTIEGALDGAGTGSIVGAVVGAAVGGAGGKISHVAKSKGFKIQKIG